MLYEVTVEFNKEIFQISKNRITIGIKSKPINGKANKEIIKKIANHFEVPSSLCRLNQDISQQSKLSKFNIRESDILFK